MDSCFYEFYNKAGEHTNTKTIIYTYDSNGNITVVTGYDRDDTNNIWVEYYKHEYTYDVNGNEILYAYYYSFDAISNTWKGYWKYEHEYDSNGNITLFAYYK